MDPTAPNQPATADELRPGEVAYLHGGAKAAVMAAVAGLHARKAVTTLRNGRFAATGIDPTTRVSAVEYAVLRALREPATLGSLRSAAAVRDALSRIDRRLRTLGFLPSVRHRWRWWLNRPTETGSAALARLRREYSDLDPAKHSTWRPREPHPAAMSVALFGSAAMPPATTGERGTRSNTAVDGGAAG